jgi:23S rRNA (uridine2552-2'-O)-methyltransferase
MPRDRKDFFYRKAKAEGYRSRAAYKLLQINKRFHLIRKGDVVVDLGAAPGGWLQVAKEISGGNVLGVDLEEIAPIEGVLTVRADITGDDTPKTVGEALSGDADVVICDAAPNLSGNWSLDHARSIDLARSALLLARKILRPGGNLLIKVFQGDMFPDFLSEMKREFLVVRSHSPEASRKASAEIYVMGLGRLAGPVRVGDTYDVHIAEIGRSGDGIALIEGFVVFVGNTRVGDSLRIKIKAVKRGYAIGTPVYRKD